MSRAAGNNKIRARAIIGILNGRVPSPGMTLAEPLSANRVSLLKLITCIFLSLIAVPVFNNTSPLSRCEGCPLPRELERTEQSEKRESGETEFSAIGITVRVDSNFENDPQQLLSSVPGPETHRLKHALGVFSSQVSVQRAQSKNFTLVNSVHRSDGHLVQVGDIEGTTVQLNFTLTGDPRPFWASDISPPI